MDGGRAPDPEQVSRQTYFGLRYGMVALAVLLYVGVLIQLVGYGCGQGSISAYYFTPVRPVLIAALAAIGVGLIIYRGSTPLENTVLDVAGFLAIVVAFVPTSTPAAGTGCSVTDQLLSGDVLGAVGPETAARIETAYVDRLDHDVMISIANSVIALFVAGFLALYLGRLIRPAAGATSPTPDTQRSRWSGVAVMVLLCIGLALYLILDRQTFRLVAHPVAAITFFALIIAVMVLNGAESTVPLYRWLYYGTAGVTILLMGVVALLHAVISWVFWIETVGVAGFVAFWLMQSHELGGSRDRSEIAPQSEARTTAR
jgi:hypothetical protein